MSVTRYNAEGYTDPTPYLALTNIAKEEKSRKAFRPLVYICSPYAGNTEENTENARKYSRMAVNYGFIPIAPHLLFTQFLDDENVNERELGLHFGNVLMDKCAEIWVCGSVVSKGMKAEIERAKRKNYKIKYIKEIKL